MTRQRWIEEGLRLLAEEGPSGMRIDRLAPRVGLTKGSFFHHFAGIAVFRRAVLDAWESGALRARPAVSVEATLGQLAAHIDDLVDVRLEAAVRAWAMNDADAAAAIERVDRARLTTLEQIWRSLVANADRAHAAALLPYLVMIGAAASRPTTSADDVRAVFALLAELVPAVAD